MSAPRYLVPEDALALIADGEMALLGEMPRASNYTFAATVGSGDGAGLVIYKPQAGEVPLHDFPDGTLYAREVAAWVVCDALGWGFVPPTVARAGPHGIGSVQVCIDADPVEHYLTLLGGDFDDELRRICAFDIVINNADRKSGHVLLARDRSRVWAIDHGVCFHAEPKLRTVIWDFAGERLPDEVSGALELLVRAVTDGATDRLAVLLEDHEVAAIAARAGTLLAEGRFPDPPSDRRPIPWPPI